MSSPTRADNLSFLSAQADEPTRTMLPPKKNFLFRLLKHPWAMPYNRLALLVVGINVLLFFNLREQLADMHASNTVLNVVIANFVVAILIRQQYVINALFAIATSVPKSWPLAVRWACAKVYHFGGIHVGGFFSGSAWFALYSLLLINTPASQKPPALTSLVCVHLALLVSMMIAALPAIRARWHNQFEVIGRFGTWASIAMFWAQTILLARYEHPDDVLAMFMSLQFWALCLVTFSVALPWMRLRKVPVSYVRPSSHVVLAKFNYGVTPFAGSSTDLSRNPLLEWHSFANVPIPGEEGFRLTISRAGDWTGRLIDDLPKEIWVKGIPTAGVGNIEKCFHKVVWVATGSGIGPCLPHILANKVPSRLVWSTRDPVRTYGEELVSDILRAQPNARIWDTTKDGKPDLVALAYRAFQEFSAEAVICIANKKATWNVVQELESRGIPAFGAIWDS